MAVGIKIETTVEFIVENSLAGRQLLDSLQRRGYRSTTPYVGNSDPDLNERYHVVRTNPSRARKLTGILTKGPGTETIRFVAKLSC